MAHIVDGLMPDQNGNLISAFEEEIKDTLMEHMYSVKRSYDGYEYPISSRLEAKISSMPGLIDWIMSSVLTRERHILLNPLWAV